MFIAQTVVFLEKEFIVEGGTESKIDLEEIQNVQVDNEHLIKMVQATNDDKA